MEEKNNSVSFLNEGIETLRDRLKELIGNQSLRSFGRKVGVSEGALRKYLIEGGSKPTFEKLLFIALANNVNFYWLATGEGDKHAPNTGAANINDAKAVDCVCKDEFDEEYALIPGYHVSVSAGNGIVNGDEKVKRRLAFRKKWLRYRRLSPEDLAVVFAKGDSMEPTINDGDSLLVDIANKALTDGKIHVLRLGDELYAKRLQKRFDGSIELLSDNKEYKGQIVPANELEHLEIIGKVVWIGKDL